MVANNPIDWRSTGSHRIATSNFKARVRSVIPLPRGVKVEESLFRYALVFSTARLDLIKSVPSTTNAAQIIKKPAQRAVGIAS